MDYIVYKITNKINGKVYYGYTGQTFNARIAQHKCDSLTKYRNTYLHNCIRKYGFDSFEFNVVEEFDTEVKARENEGLLISVHKTNVCRYRNGNGMNSSDGGEIGVRGYDQTGRKLSEKTKEKVSESLKKYYKKSNTKHPLLGKTGLQNVRSKKVIRIDKKTLIPDCVFFSVCEAAKEMKSHQNAIYDVLYNKRKSHKGYIWRYA